LKNLGKQGRRRKRRCNWDNCYINSNIIEGWEDVLHDRRNREYERDHGGEKFIANSGAIGV
jgi:hypothetical protein